MEKLKQLAKKLPALLAALAAALAAWGLKRKDDGTGAPTLAEARAWAADTLPGLLFGLVTKAEREYGGGTGRLKLADVMAGALALIPEKYRAFFGTDALAAYIESALSRAKLAWEENPALIAPVAGIDKPAEQENTL